MNMNILKTVLVGSFLLSGINAVAESVQSDKAAARDAIVRAKILKMDLESKRYAEGKKAKTLMEAIAVENMKMNLIKNYVSESRTTTEKLEIRAYEQGTVKAKLASGAAELAALGALSSLVKKKSKALFAIVNTAGFLSIMGTASSLMAELSPHNGSTDVLGSFSYAFLIEDKMEYFRQIELMESKELVAEMERIESDATRYSEELMVVESSVKDLDAQLAQLN